MVLHRRLNYGFNGYEVPPIPRAARSIRKRSLHRNNVGDNQMCAFDLLATVAGEILLEGQNSATASSNGICENVNILDTVKEELRDDSDTFLNAKDLNHGSPENGLVVDEQKPQVQNQSDKEIINPLSSFCSKPSAIAASGWTDKTDFSGNKALDDKNSQSVNGDALKKVEGCSFGDLNSRVPKQEDHVSDYIQSQLATISEGSFGGGLGHCSSEGPKLMNQEPPALVNSDNSKKLYVHRDHYSCGSPFLSRDNVKVVSRDDDENSCRCAQRSTAMKTSRSRPLSRHRRIRKLLAYRYWRRPQKVKNQDLSDTAGELHSVNQYRIHGFKRQRSQRIYPPKKKLFFSSPSTSDGVTGYESRYLCSEKDTGKPTSAFGAIGHGGMLSVVAGQSTSFQSRESHVKVKIKSFRVPELFIELPETATVGSLKKRVMEAITTLLGGELHVGVVLKGRKIKDDSKTLVQTGISHDNKAAGLGFTLEPNRSQVYSSMGSEDMPLIGMPQPASRPAPAASMTHQSIHASADTPAKDLADFIKSDHDSELVPAEISMDNGSVDSKALVIVPEANAEALEVVPPPKKSKRYEMAQRRIRRPFSVGEVEALVGAVENLGTGRWRDVKLLAFDSADHRTYVDLKDKWKTLVHTARISPQQRRGEPVPQELLDRVLAAHDHWSQPQAKQQPNLQPEATLLLGK